MKHITVLSDYRTLGRSGLVVSPLALGTMTFGTARWGSGEDGSRAVFNTYVEAGGNFVDTADVYSSGRSEEMLGGFIAERGLRDQMVVATKAGFATSEGLLAGGNGAKHIHVALDGSLRRLRTDYVDLFWLHVWDSVTPAEELLETMTALVRVGKIRYWGMSNAPAWYVAKLTTLAAVRGMSGPIALQYFYSLVNRDIEDEHIPLASEFGMGILPWSPPHDIQLMSKHRVLSLKPQLRLEWRGQDGQNETEQAEHSASLGDSITSRFGHDEYRSYRSRICRELWKTGFVPSSFISWAISWIWQLLGRLSCLASFNHLRLINLRIWRLSSRPPLQA